MLNEQWELLAKWKERARGNKLTRCDLAFGSNNSISLLVHGRRTLGLSPRSFSVHVWTSPGTPDYSASCSDSPCSSLSRIDKITRCDSLLPACFFLLHQRRHVHICFSKIFPSAVVSKKAFSKKKNSKKSVDLWALNLPHTQSWSATPSSSTSSFLLH